MDSYHRVELRKAAPGAQRLETRFGLFDRAQEDESAVDSPVKVLALSPREAAQLDLDGRFDLKPDDPPPAPETPMSRLLRRSRRTPSGASPEPEPEAAAGAPAANEAPEATAAEATAPDDDDDADEKTTQPTRTRRRRGKGKGGQE